MRAWILFAVLVWQASAEQLDPVVDRLCHVRMFAFGGVGFVGLITQGQKDYDAILSRASAESDFEKVFANGNRQAKAYALAALRKLDPEKFKSLSMALRSSKDEAETGGGCILMRRPLGELVKGIEAGAY